MATQRQTSLSVTSSGGYLEPLQGLLNENQEIDLSSMGFGPRIEALKQFQESHPANYIALEQNILSQLPAGANLMPIPVLPKMADCWHGNDARNMRLKEGHVEPKADYYIKIAQMLGVRFELTFEGTVQDTGKAQYEVRYNARMMMPTGEVIEATDEGKASDLTTSSGSIQAHIKEMVRKKAKRNAVKALLGLPTTMEQSEYLKPWVIFKPVFRKGKSAEVDNLISIQQEAASANVRKLYGDTTPTLDGVDASVIEGLKADFQSANSGEEIQDILRRAKRMLMTGEQYGEVMTAAKQRSQELKGGQ